MIESGLIYKITELLYDRWIVAGWHYYTLSGPFGEFPIQLTMYYTMEIDKQLNTYHSKKYKFIIVIVLYATNTHYLIHYWIIFDNVTV